MSHGPCGLLGWTCCVNGCSLALVDTDVSAPGTSAFDRAERFGTRWAWPVKAERCSVGLTWLRDRSPSHGPPLRVEPGGGARVQLVPGHCAGIGARRPLRFLVAGHADQPAEVRAFQAPASKTES